MSLEKTDIAAVLAGTEAAAKSFLEALKALVFRIARRQYRFTQEDCEDVLAQMLEKLWERDGAALRRWRGECPLETYLAVVTNRFCLMRLRATKRSPETSPEEHADHVSVPAPAESIDARERWDACRSALGRLAERDRRIIEMRYLSGWEYDRITTELGLTHGAARKALHSALERLRGELRKQAPGFLGR